MVNPDWLDELRTQLREQGLPPAYVERFLEELSDHWNDLLEEGADTGTLEPSSFTGRLGSPISLAQAAAAEYRRARAKRSWSTHMRNVLGLRITGHRFDHCFSWAVGFLLGAACTTLVLKALPSLALTVSFGLVSSLSLCWLVLGRVVPGQAGVSAAGECIRGPA